MAARPAPVRIIRNYGTNLSPQGQYVVVCPACNAVLPVPPTAVAKTYRYRRCKCTCGVQLTVQVPPFGVRKKRAALCPARKILEGTQAALLVPAVPCAHELPRSEPGTGWDFLRTKILEQPPDKELDNIAGVRQQPVVEQLGLCIRLGLPLDQAVLAALGTEAHYLLAHHPRLGVVEQVMAMLVSVALPLQARERPPEWVHAKSRSIGQVPWFFHQRVWYTWARVRPFSTDVAGYAAGYAHRLREIAGTMAVLRPWVLKNIRVIRALDWDLSHKLIGVDTTSPAWAIWRTCCGGDRLDTTDAHRRYRQDYSGLTEL